jgi:hypothetical protein
VPPFFGDQCPLVFVKVCGEVPVPIAPVPVPSFVLQIHRHAIKRRQQIPWIVLGLDFRRRLFRSVALPLIRIIHRKPVCLMPQNYHAARIF